MEKKIELPNKKNPHHLLYVTPPINSSQSDNLQEPLSILGDCIDERKELYFQCETEEGADELKKADLDSCVSDQLQMESFS